MYNRTVELVKQRWKVENILKHRVVNAIFERKWQRWKIKNLKLRNREQKETLSLMTICICSDTLCACAAATHKIGQRFLPIKKFGGTRRFFFLWFAAVSDNLPAGGAPCHFSFFTLSLFTVQNRSVYYAHLAFPPPWLPLIYSKLTVGGSLTSWVTLKEGAKLMKRHCKHTCAHMHIHTRSRTNTLWQMMLQQEPPSFRVFRHPMFLPCLFLRPREVISPLQGS